MLTCQHSSELAELLIVTKSLGLFPGSTRRLLALTLWWFLFQLSEQEMNIHFVRGTRIRAKGVIIQNSQRIRSENVKRGSLIDRKAFLTPFKSMGERKRQPSLFPTIPFGARQRRHASFRNLGLGRRVLYNNKFNSFPATCNTWYTLTYLFKALKTSIL